MKRYLAALLALVLLLTGLAAVASAGSWSGEWYMQENGKWYLFNESTGEKINVPAGWFQGHDIYTADDGTKEDYPFWVYGAGDGTIVKGWKQIGGNWYYFGPDMATWNGMEIDGEYHLFTTDGVWLASAKKEGWVKSGNNWYYLLHDVGSDEDYGESWDYYYFAWDGIYEIDNKLYYFDKNYKLVTKTGWVAPYKDADWVKENNYQYYLRFWAYVQADGSLAEGWKKIDGKWYFFNEEGRMSDQGAAIIGDKRYVFDYLTGQMVSGKWYHDTWIDYWGSEEVVYGDWLYLGADGAAKTGWFQYGGKWYYADEWGNVWLDCPVYDDQGNEYWLGKDGDMLLGWQQVYGTDWSYFKDSGAMAKKEWVQYGGKWYYFDENGLMVHDCTITINGTEYKFDANGVCVL